MTSEEKIEHLRKEIKKYGKDNPERVILLSDKLLKIAYSLNNKKLEYEGLNNIVVANIDIKNYEEALKYGLKANSVVEFANDTSKAKLYNNIGSIYFFMKNSDSAVVYYEKSLETNIKIDNKNEIINLQNNLAFLYQTIEKYDRSLEYYFELLRTYDKNNDIEKKTDVLRRIGQIYLYLKKFDDAINYTKQAADIIREEGDEKKLAKILITIGNIYYEKEDYESAMTYYSEAFDYVKDISSSKGKAVLMNNIGLIHKHFGNHKEAFKFIEESINIRYEINSTDDLVSPYTSLAELSMKQGQFYKAISYLKKAESFAKEHNKNSDYKSIYQLLYTSYRNLEIWDQALVNYEKYQSITDSLMSKELSETVESIKIDYETEKKETENRMLKEQNAAQRLYFTIISGLIFILLILFYAKYRSKQEANRRLNEKNERIREQHEELQLTFRQLQKSEEQLREANATKDKFFSIIAHDLKNPIHAITLSSDLLINKYKYMDAEQLVEVVQNINKSGNHLSALLTNLLQWARAKTSSIDFQPEIIDLKESSQEVFNLLDLNAKKKEIKIIDNIPDKTFLFADPNMLETILRNLISNAIKFTPHNGFISVTSSIEGSEIALKIKDNGIGISKEDQEKLFRLDVHHTTNGTYNEKGTGLGLLLCKEFAERHHGTIIVDSTPGQGSTFIVKLPINVAETMKKKNYSDTSTPFQKAT